MNISVIKKLPSAEEIIMAHPLSARGHTQIAQDRQDIKNILSGKDDRFLVIVGPCSAWPSDAVTEYARRLVAIKNKIQNKVKIVLRVYIQKPRTTKGWTGPVNQPDPFKEPDIEQGITYSRKLMVEMIEAGLAIADEAVFTHNARGFIELLSWVAIGARSTEDQEHRIFASAVDCPVGMKNPTSGLLDLGVNSIVAAQHPHTAVLDGHQVETQGNEYAHLVLRGGIDGPTYSYDHLQQAKQLIEKNACRNPAIIVDASHDNCKVNGVKDYRAQIAVVHQTLETLREHPELRTIVKGFMIESFLKGECQKVESLTPQTIDRDGLSITDPCLSWDDTVDLLEHIAREKI